MTPADLLLDPTGKSTVSIAIAPNMGSLCLLQLTYVVLLWPELSTKLKRVFAFNPGGIVLGNDRSELLVTTIVGIPICPRDEP